MSPPKPSDRLSLITNQLPGGAPAPNLQTASSSAPRNYTPSTPPPRPPFSSLPLDPSGPGRNCWGLFGPSDELGQLNYITPAVTKAAAQEITHGIKIALDLPVNFFDPPSFSRMAPKHEVIELGPAAHDDTLHFNTQGSTQWDGFRHVGYRKQRLWYNGTTRGEILGGNVMGTDAWVRAGGFATRGILLDYARWAASKNLSRPPFERTPITLSELRQIASSQNLTLRPGDVLMIRTGYLASYPSLPLSTRTARHKSGTPPTIGLEQSEDLIRWIWESGVVAVASDSPSLEAWPAFEAGGPNVLHENFLAGWGMPIGEYFDLEGLAGECERVGRWSFFFTSVPLNVPGGVGTPVNGIAIL